jgi:hypothetical protein
MAFRPLLYRRWVLSTGSSLLPKSIADGWLRRTRTHRLLGVLFIAFGVCSFVWFLWIAFVQ